MNNETNKQIALRAFDTLFNKRDYATAEALWSPAYVQHSAYVPGGRDGLFKFIKSLPKSLRYEAGLAVSEGDHVILHGRFSGHGLRRNWIVADILRIKDGLLMEHWDVIQDEATQQESKGGKPMFGETFALDGAT